MNLVECIEKTPVSEDGLENSLENDVRKSAVQSLMLTHVEHEHHSLTSRLGTYQMLQLLCQQHRHLYII